MRYIRCWRCFITWEQTEIALELPQTVEKCLQEARAHIQTENALCDNSPMHQKILQTLNCARYEIIEVIIIKLYVEKAWIRSHVHLKGITKAKPLCAARRKFEWLRWRLMCQEYQANYGCLLLHDTLTTRCDVSLLGVFPSARRMVNVTFLSVRIRFAVW